MSQILVRFVVGGAIVSLFALLGDLLRPKGFAGLFAAAPSVALASLTFAAVTQGHGYAALEARSMIAGEVAFVVYAVGCVYFLAIRRARSAPTAIGMLAIWGVAVAVLYAGVLR
jgi:uncharacterized membrane protein (GlpM family)